MMLSTSSMSKPLGEFMNRSLLCTRFCSSIVRHAITQREHQHPEAWPASTYRHLIKVLVGGALGPCGTQSPGTRLQGHSVVRHSDAAPILCMIVIGPSG